VPAGRKQYFHLLNAIRGIAAILVVGRHTALFMPIISPVSYMAVDIFFLLSGVVIDSSYQQKLVEGMSSLQFLWIRVVRIYPLYILGTTITVAALLLAGPHLKVGMAPLDITHPALHLLFALFLLPAQFGHSMMFVFDHPAWSLFYELAVNIVYAFIVTHLTTRSLGAVIAFFGLSLLGSLAYFHPHVELGFQGPQAYFAGLSRAGFSFFLGVGLYRLSKVVDSGIITRNSSAATVVVLAAVVLGLMAIPSPAHELPFYIFCVFLFFPITVFTAMSVESSPITKPIWDFLGDISYAIYALHVPVIIFISSVLIVPYQKHHVWQNLIVRMVYAASLLAVAYAADKTYDKGARTFLRGLWRERPQAPVYPWRLPRP
jgi:peptidoglycan/LPS O-acetylase OafA/YrhL